MPSQVFKADASYGARPGIEHYLPMDMVVTSPLRYAPTQQRLRRPSPRMLAAPARGDLARGLSSQWTPIRVASSYVLPLPYPHCHHEPERSGMTRRYYRRIVERKSGVQIEGFEWILYARAS